MSTGAFLLFLAIVIGLVAIFFILLLIQILSFISRVEREILPKVSGLIGEAEKSVVKVNAKLDQLDISGISGALRIVNEFVVLIEPVIAGMKFGFNLAKRLRALFKGHQDERSGKM